MIRQMMVPFFALVMMAGCGPTMFKAPLSGNAEVPAVTSSGTGSVTATVDGTKIDITGTYSGLSGAASAAHIHGPADATTTAGVACALTVTEGATAGSGTISGECANFDIQGMTQGKYYANVHTMAHQAGEIRGQFAKQ